MSADNTVTLVGNLTDEPELRFTPSGQPVANFTVAVNRRFRNRDGQWEDKLDGFFRCNCWQNLAENVAESLVKGTRVLVVGRLQQRSWDDGEGNKRSTLEIQVDEIGPSLRWATASVTKSQKTGASGWQGGGDRPQQQQQEPASQSAPAEGSSSWGSPSPAPVSGPPPGDEAGF